MIHGWPDTHALWDPQVAVLAPTTVLVRQHLQTFAKRFAKQQND